MIRDYYQEGIDTVKNKYAHLDDKQLQSIRDEATRMLLQESLGDIRVAVEHDNFEYGRIRLNDSLFYLGTIRGIDDILCKGE